MLFDDRLDTVLRSRVSGEAAGRTQFRQLLDLLGRPHEAANEDQSKLHERAFNRLDELAKIVSAQERAKILQEPWLTIANPNLVKWFVGKDARPAAAALATAQLSGEDWAELIPRLDVTSRGLLRHRRDLPEPANDMLMRLGVGDLVLPMPAAQTGEAPSQPIQAEQIGGTQEAPNPATINPAAGNPAAGNPATGIAIAGAAAIAAGTAASAKDKDSAIDTPQGEDKSESEQAISALRRRIEEYQLAKKQGVKEAHPSRQSHGDPRLPLGDEPETAPHITSFHFASDASGLVTWAEPRIAPLLVGAKIANPSRWSIFDPAPALIAAMAERRPLSSAALTISGAQDITGDWLVDAAPLFTPENGRFDGYVGRIRRQKSTLQGANDTAGPLTNSGDQMRELLHELRTPVNAIQGFAEIIQQQVFGRVPNAYRALAAAIALDAANLLGGFDEIDRLAKLDSGAMDLEEGQSDWREAVSLTMGRLNTVLAPKEAGFELTVSGSPFIVPLDREEALALAWRILASLAAMLAPGEKLALTLHSDGAGDHTNPAAALTIPLPAAFPQEGDAFASSSGPKQASSISSGMFGTGFTLRLARQETRAAGGSLEQAEGEIMVNLPVLTGKHSKHSPDTETISSTGAA